MEKRKIEARLKRILERLELIPDSSESTEGHEKPIGKMKMSSRIDRIENYDQSTAFNDHSNWPNWSDRG